MDPLSLLLSGIRAEGAQLTHAVLRAPWVIRFTDDAALTIVTVIHGGGTLLLPTGAHQPVRVGDTAVIQATGPFRLASSPHHTGTATEYEIACFTPECADARLCTSEPGDESAQTTLIVGAYRATGRRHERLLRTLPPVLVVNDDQEEDCAWIDAVMSGLDEPLAGAQAMRDRIMDWGLICTLRSWFAQAAADAPAWYRGLLDPVTSPALEAIHTRPAAPWTVASLAAAAGVSRALFAKRFREVMDVPPLQYLTEHRMSEAAELLSDRGRTIADIARAVGYADAFGFSAAFKRHHGMRPSELRAAA